MVERSRPALRRSQDVIHVLQPVDFVVRFSVLPKIMLNMTPVDPPDVSSIPTERDSTVQFTLVSSA